MIEAHMEGSVNIVENCINCTGFDPLRNFCEYHEIDLTGENLGLKICIDILGYDDLWSDEL